MSYDTLVSGYFVLPKGEPIYSEQATIIRLEDESGGLFVVIEQSPGDKDTQKVSFTHEEWPLIKRAIEKLVKVCKERDEVKS